MKIKRYEDLEPQERVRRVRDAIGQKYNTPDKMIAYVKKLERELGPRKYVDLSKRKKQPVHLARKKKTA